MNTIFYINSDIKDTVLKYCDSDIFAFVTAFKIHLDPDKWNKVKYIIKHETYTCASCYQLFPLSCITKCIFCDSLAMWINESNVSCCNMVSSCKGCIFDVISKTTNPNMVLIRSRVTGRTIVVNSCNGNINNIIIKFIEKITEMSSNQYMLYDGRICDLDKYIAYNQNINFPKIIASFTLPPNTQCIFR